MEEEIRPVKMVRRVGGIMGELGRGLRALPGKVGPLNVDIISVGPLFQELDRRFLSDDIRKTPFCRITPM